MSLAKTASVVDELGSVFAVEEDEEFARNIVRTRAEIDSICDSKEKQIQAIIHGHTPLDPSPPSSDKDGLLQI